MKRILMVALCLAFLAGFTGCSRNGHNTVTLAGSTAFQPFAEKLAEQYLATHKDVHINVQGGGSAVGIQSALSGSADIGMADLPDLPPETKPLEALVVAKDGIAIIVNPKNSITALSSAQARDIFSGKVSNWKDAGGLDAPIRVISREDGSGTRRTFDKQVLKNDKLSAGALFQNSNGTVREAVASDPNAIGYLSIGLIDPKVKPLTYDGVVASNDNVKNGKYPLARPVYFLTKQKLSPVAKAFEDYVLSPDAQKTLEKEGLITVR